MAMVCTSGSVQSVADKTQKAKEQINRLEQMIKQQEGVHKSFFFETIKSHLTDAHINDAREISYNSDIKTEYTSEFSLDKIAKVVTSALNAVVKATDPAVKQPATSPEAIQAYSDMVNSVAEAAKSSSTSSASLSFSMNRLSPGLYAFLYASSVNIKDEDTFGSEAVTTTAIYYKFIQSINDVKNEAKFGEAVIDYRNLMNMKTLQAALTDALASGNIDIDEWTKKDEKYSIAIKTIEARLEAAKWDKAVPLKLDRAAGFGASVEHSFVEGSKVNREVVKAAIQRLAVNGAQYRMVIERSESRLASLYY